MTSAPIDYGALLKETFDTSIRSENVVPLVVGGLLTMFIGGLSLGVLFPPLLVGFTRICLGACRDQPVAIDTLWSGFSRFGAAWIVVLLIAALAVVTSCTVVGPFVIALFATFTFHHLVDHEELGAVDAMKRSFEVVKGNFLEVFIVALIGGAFNVVLGATGIGGIAAFAFVGVLNANLYLRLTASSTSSVL